MSVEIEYPPVLPPFNETWTNWNLIPDAYTMEETIFVLLDQNGKKWDLNGPRAGRQGAQFGENITGMFQTPFTGKWSEGAYQIGGTLERIDYPKREIQCQIILGKQMSCNPGTGNMRKPQYRIIEERWWSGWRDKKQDCFLGCFTRTHGWRWIKVRMLEAPKTTVVRDPTAHDNNLLAWDMTIVAAMPFWSKRGFMNQWKNDADNAELFGVGKGEIHWVNRGDFDAWPKYLISAATGECQIQDGVINRMVDVATSSIKDGYILYDTDPTARIATSENEPVDNIFFELIRAAAILDFFLGEIAELGEPVWRRLRGRAFACPLPPRSFGSIKVQHTALDVSISMIVPQHFDMPYG
jgi:hypothetical protein